jgi:4-diphosphocytidyl-2-C-methyl-D-erythritol kinase
MRALWDVPAPAKVNLFLHVVGRRPDGYHLLQSAFALIDWCDTLHFELRDDGRLQRHDLGAALPADDLVLRAARTLQAAAGTALGADIAIDKRVPWGAGLGGGSSDAASTLLALNVLWGLRWPRERLQQLAVTLGADVPFFVGGRNAFVEGIGEVLTPIDLPPQWLAIVKPSASIVTAEVFAARRVSSAPDAAILLDFLADAELSQKLLAGFGRNDLQPPAQGLCSEVTQVAEWLQSRYGNSRMSGSGSAVFSRAGTGDQPAATWSDDELPPHWVGRLCRSLRSHPLAGWAD